MTKKKYVMSTREKVLITVLLVLAAVVGTGWYLVIPIRDAHSIARDDVDFMRSFRMRTMQEIMSVPEMQARVDELSVMLEEYRERLTPFVETENLEYDFTQFLIKNGVNPVSVMLTHNAQVRGEMTGFTVNINANASYIDKLLLLSDYANSVYSYRLTRMRLADGVGTYTVEAVLGVR
jgi:Tfp pilus assembly protein PilO